MKANELRIGNLVNECYSVQEIARATNSPISHINNIINNKSQFTANDIDSYLKFANISFWQFCYSSINLSHLSKKTRKQIKLCRE